MSLRMVRLTLQREGRQHQVQSDQVHVDCLRRLFQVNPEETWLRDTIDDTLYFPQPDGNFDLSRVILLSELVVEGPSNVPTRQRSTAATSSSTVSSTPSPLPPPVFRSVIAPKRAASFSLKVHRADMMRTNTRKPHFEQKQQMFLDLVEGTANVDYILANIHRKWGHEYRLVTSDGMQLEDSPATQGTDVNFSYVIIYN